MACSLHLAVGLSASTLPPLLSTAAGHDEICAQKPPENYPVKRVIAEEDERERKRATALA